MNTNIYNQIKEVIGNYPLLREPEFFYRIYKRINEFSEDIIEKNLKTKLEEVLKTKYMYGPMPHQSILFQVPTNVNLTNMLTEYFEIRLRNPLIFDRVAYSENHISNEVVNELAIKNFKVLQNRFLDSQKFYFYGIFDIEYNNYASVNNIRKNHILFDGLYGGKGYALFSSNLHQEFKTRVREEAYQKWALYGSLSFDNSWKANIINVNQFYHV